jgi:hypothetical protein
MIKEIKIIIRVDEDKNIIGIAEDFSKLDIKGINKTLFVLGVYGHLYSHQLQKLNSVKRYSVPK